MYTFYHFCCELGVVAVIYCCMFIALIINERNLQAIKLSVWKTLRLYWQNLQTFRMFFYRSFLHNHTKIFFDTTIVSRYYLKFLSNKNCSYWIKGTFEKIILASGAPITVTFFHVSFHITFYLKINFWRTSYLTYVCKIS